MIIAEPYWKDGTLKDFFDMVRDRAVKIEIMEKAATVQNVPR